MLAPQRDVTLRVRCGDTVLAQKKEFRVNPGEMNSIAVNTADAAGGEIVVEVG